MQEVIISSEHAYDSWSLLHSEFGAKGDLVVKRLRKEFSSVVMTEASCGEYIKRVRRLVAELRECGDLVKDEDVAYTILLGLGEKYSPLVVTLTNMSSAISPLSLVRVCEQVLTEELRLRQFNTEHQEHHPLANHPLAYKPDTTYRGDLQQSYLHNACVARTSPSPSLRQSPYPMRSSSGFVVRGRQTAPPISVSNTSSPTTLWTQQQQHRVWVDSGQSQDVYRQLPWSSAP